MTLVSVVQPSLFSNTYTSNHASLFTVLRLSMTSLNSLRLVSSTLMNSTLPSLLDSLLLSLWLAAPIFGWCKNCPSRSKGCSWVLDLAVCDVLTVCAKVQMVMNLI